MTLARVGMDAGPDLARLTQLQRLNTACRMYAAGGVRQIDDLTALARAGAAGVLLASALHAGRLSRPELDAFHAAHPTSAASGARASVQRRIGKPTQQRLAALALPGFQIGAAVLAP